MPQFGLELFNVLGYVWICVGPEAKLQIGQRGHVNLASGVAR
ncbi:hypothetical protein Q31b_57000 [Novipirellula aureliae]|uniref:Uncharacterized protein n=1 Tax=Novipirellula aureliae TaxID=2527966 RepID=A0A5C6D922_9BACT|nr:hypothetical protein Q31b_57000 [Novipirellula aureliae]